MKGKSIGLIQNVFVQIVNTKTQLVLAEGLTQNNGNISLSVLILGDESELFIKIPKQEIGNYKIDSFDPGRWVKNKNEQVFKFQLSEWNL